MKYALIPAIAALGFASAAVAQNTYDTATVMARNVPAEQVVGPQEVPAFQGKVATETFGNEVELKLDSVLFPREAAQNPSGVITGYAFDGATGNSAYDLSAR